MDTLVSTGELLREVARLHIQLQRACVEYCSGTTVTQCSVLTELGRNGGAMTLAELSRRLYLDKGWISRAVEQMTQEGLIEKLAGEVDRRVVQLSLTADGKQRLSELNRSLNGLVEQVMEHVPQQDHVSIHHALTLLLGALRGKRQSELPQIPLPVPRVRRHCYGAITAIQGIFLAVCAASGPLAAGWLYDLFGSYDVPFWLCALGFLVATTSLLFIPRSRFHSS